MTYRNLEFFKEKTLNSLHLGVTRKERIDSIRILLELIRKMWRGVKAINGKKNHSTRLLAQEQ